MLTLAAEAEHADEIKKSRFIARAAAVTGPDEALVFVERVRDPSATHNCWAFRVGDTYRFSDDGEPGGTAGKPILGAIDRAGLDRVVVVVTRFFGGTKLGAGGLARAYGGTAASCLRLAAKRELRHKVRVRIQAGFDAIGRVYTLMEQYGAEKRDQKYTAEGVEIEVLLFEDCLDDFSSALRDASRGSVGVQRLRK